MMEDLRNKIIECALLHDKAIQEGKSREANRLNRKCIKLFGQIKEEDRIRFLLDLAKHPNENVKLFAASYLLDYDEETALRILDEIIESPRLIGLTARGLKDMWLKGMIPSRKRVRK